MIEGQVDVPHAGESLFFPLVAKGIWPGRHSGFQQGTMDCGADEKRKEII